MTVLRRNMFRYRRSRTVQGCALGVGFMLIFAWKLYWPNIYQSDVMLPTQNQEYFFDPLSKDDVLGLSDQLLLWQSKGKLCFFFFSSLIDLCSSEFQMKIFLF